MGKSCIFKLTGLNNHCNAICNGFALKVQFKYSDMSKKYSWVKEM